MLLRKFVNGLSQFSYDKIGNFLIFLIELKSILLNLLITLLNFTFSGFDVIFYWLSKFYSAGQDHQSNSY